MPWYGDAIILQMDKDEDEVGCRELIKKSKEIVKKAMERTIPGASKGRFILHEPTDEERVWRWDQDELALSEEDLERIIKNIGETRELIIGYKCFSPYAV